MKLGTKEDGDVRGVFELEIWEACRVAWALYPKDRPSIAHFCEGDVFATDLNAVAALGKACLPKRYFLNIRSSTGSATVEHTKMYGCVFCVNKMDTECLNRLYAVLYAVVHAHEAANGGEPMEAAI